MGHTQDMQSFGDYSDCFALEGLREAINHVDWALYVSDSPEACVEARTGSSKR
jgi:hypothetical protein